MRANLGLGLSGPPDAYAVGGYSPVLRADFKNGYYRKAGVPVSFTDLLNETGTGSLGAGGWSMDSTTDTLTIAAANLPYASAMSIWIKGTFTYDAVAHNNRVTFWRWRETDWSRYLLTKIDNNPTDGLFITQHDDDTVSTKIMSEMFTPGSDIPFSIATRHGAGVLQAAVNGTLLSLDATPDAMPSLSTVVMELGFKGVFTMEQFAMWHEDIGASAITSASSE